MTPTPQQPPSSLAQLQAEALAAMQAAGLPFEELQVNAGWKRHRKQDAVWYIADAGTGRTGRPWLQVSAGDARLTGGVDEATLTWQSWGGDHATLDRPELDHIQRELQKAAQQRKEQQAKARQAAAEKAIGTWAKAEDDTNGHAYLESKGVQAHGIRRLKTQLLVPVADTGGTLHGLQAIRGDGSKKFNPGAAVRGHYHLLGAVLGQRLYLAEGYATAATIHESTGEATACCFNAGNLKPVAEVLRAAHPGVELVICADDDQWTEGNPGVIKATEAAAAVGAAMVVPTFTDTSTRPTDFNDMHQLQGIEEVRRQLSGAERVESTETWPEPQPLPDTRPPVAAFDPAALLPGPMRPWLSDVADRLQCPPDYPAVGGMVSLGAVVGRQLGIKPKRMDSWLEVPNLWGGIVGRPGIMKSPALAEAMKPLHRLAHEARLTHEQEQEDRERGEELRDARLAGLRAELKKAVNGKASRNEQDISADIEDLKQEGEPQPCPRYAVNDCTVEKLGEILSENPNGVLLFRDELVGWLRQLDREGAENTRPFYLESWNGTGSYTYDRIGRGTVHIEAACVAVLGGIQPGPLADYVKGALSSGKGADGLLQRLQLLVWPDDPGTWKDVDRWPDTEVKNQAFELFQRMARLDLDHMGAQRDEDQPIPWLRFDDAAQKVFTKWRFTLENQRLRSGEHEAMEAHLSKYRKLVPTLALLCHLAEGDTGPVSETALLRACAWDEYLETHARRLYASVVLSQITAAHALAAKIREGKVPDVFTPKQVYSKHWRDLSKDRTYQAIEVLEDHDWIKTAKEPTGGRPTLRCWTNPRLGVRA